MVEMHKYIHDTWYDDDDDDDDTMRYTSSCVANQVGQTPTATAKP